jgi:DNA-binding CsgD family transcriptional regulator
LERLVETTRPAGTDYGLGVEARAHALVTDEPDQAEAHYRSAIDRLRRAGMKPDLARSHLLFGEHLRELGREPEAQEQLRLAFEHFAAMGMQAFAERARRGLLATGGWVASPARPRQDALTPQEAHIARLAADGLSNREIAARLFLSNRTVEWHLRNVFTKLGLSSRHDLPATGSRQEAATT